MAVGHLAAARLAVLPFAPLLWLCACALVASAGGITSRIPKSARGLVGALAAGVVLGGILSVQMDVYSRISGVRALENDSYFFALLLVEIAVALLVILRLAYTKRRKEGSRCG